ncbi:MAG TPA: efflux RND transporter periplasmic adaptor subunit [Agriterribacter sp.]|nr:efflux RND transporter periplasmic adaptor subunit [Agriterribacter sp.]
MKKRTQVISIILLNVITLGGLSSCKNNSAETHQEAAQKQTYTCSMHPQIISDKPGSCPICGMDLVLFDKTSSSGLLTLSVPQLALANVTTDTIKVGNFSSFKQLNGRLTVDPSQTEVLSSRVAGRIETLYVKQTGVPVKKGQPLYTIYSEQLAAIQQEYLVAIAQQEQFPEDKKFMQLADASRQKLLLYGQSEAQIQQLKSKKQTNPFVTYSSTTDAVVSALPISEGQYVAEGSPVVGLEEYRSIWVEADVYPTETGMIKKGSIVNVTVAGFENEPQKMGIEFIAPALQNGRQLLSIRGSIPNLHNQLRAGMQAVIDLPVASSSRAITLPVDAVIHNADGAHIWVETGVGKFEPKMVETGAENFNRVEITSGVTEGDVVVISGAYLLYSEFILKKGKDPMAGHHH